MYVQKLTLEIKNEYPTGALLDEFYWLMTMYRKSGQIQVQGGFNTQCVEGNLIMAFVYTLEKTSLNKKNNTLAVTNQIKKLEKISGSKINREIVGTEYQQTDSACTCSHPESYTLTSLLFSRESAVVCNSCSKSVPLYRIPVMPNGDYDAVLQWHLSSLYLNGIETLNLDREDFPEIPTSLINALDNQADEIVSHIESNTGIRVHKLASVTPPFGDKLPDTGFFEMSE